MIKFWRLYYNKNKIIININYHNFLNNHNFTSLWLKNLGYNFLNTLTLKEKYARKS
ncbi:hypothetical protein B10460_01350 [Campylobacter coli]|nr:hypothetical protein B10328_01310 [Campylobacter coli]BEJ81565.1 hypothetical protein B10460_01350 [Campylobacter coli]